MSGTTQKPRGVISGQTGIHLNTLGRVLTGGKYTFDTLYQIEQALKTVPEKEVI